MVKKKKKEKESKVTKNLLQGDRNQTLRNQLKLKVDVSIHWTTLVNSDDSRLKDVYIPCLW